MTQEDPSERFLKENLISIAETPERFYLIDESSNMLVASWKPGKASAFDSERYQFNALQLAELIKTRKPETLLLDCRYLVYEISYHDHLWYIQQTRALWEKAKVKRVAFVFRANLSVQVAMEELKEAAQDEGIKAIEYRIFECNVEAAGWLKGSK
jgi:hypothetical protein